MQKIKRISCYFKWFFQLIFIVLPILLIIFWVNAPSSVSEIAAKAGFSIRFIPDGIPILHPLSINTKILGFLIDIIPMIVNLLILYFLIALFKLFEMGDIFSVKSVVYIKRIGYMILLGQLLNPFYQALMTAAMTWHNPPGHRLISITLGSTNIALLLTALLIILVSWIMAEGYKLKEEQAFTI